MMKNRNQNPITDALNHLDEETVRACMESEISAHTAAPRQRIYPKLAIAAACLTLTAAVGVTALLPLLRAHDPALPGTISDIIIQNGEPSYPFVRLQVLSYDESASDTSIEDEDATNDGLTIDSNNQFRNSNLILHFDCAEGERVVITSHSAVSPLSDELANTLAALDELEDPEGDRDPKVDEALRRKLERKLYMLQRKYQAYQRNNGIIKVNDVTYMWNVPQNPDEYEVIDFTIYNAEDGIVGAGSICIGIRPTHYLYQLRTTVLGSERFDAPLTAEEATAYLDSLHATAEDAYTAMDFTPNSDTEGYALARSAVTDILQAEYPDPLERDSCHYGAGGCDFEWYTFNKTGSPETMRRFFLFSDGTYVEVAPEGAAAFDGMLYQLFESTEVVKADFSELSILLTDGRILRFAAEAYTDPIYGFQRTMWVTRITEATGTQNVI